MIATSRNEEDGFPLVGMWANRSQFRVGSGVSSSRSDVVMHPTVDAEVGLRLPGHFVRSLRHCNANLCPVW